MRFTVRTVAFAALLGTAACATKVVDPPVVTAPRYPEYMEPGVPADLRESQAALHQSRAWTFLQGGDLRNAEREATLALRSNPGFYPANATSGWVHLAQNNPREAVERFEKALAIRPEYVPAWFGKAKALDEGERDVDAIAAYRSALSLDPSLVDVPRRIEVLRLRVVQREVEAARQAVRSGKPDEAIRAYGAAIIGSPDSAFLYRELAVVERSQGLTEPALQHFRRATSLDPFDSASLVDIADMLADANELESAVKAYNDALAIAPDAAVERRRNAVRDRWETTGLPAEYRAIAAAPKISRADLAALIGVRLSMLVENAPPRTVDVVTDVRGNWAERWMMSMLRAGVMDSYPNHTFQPRGTVRRVDFAEAVTRLLGRVGQINPGAPRPWEGARGRFPERRGEPSGVSLRVGRGRVGCDANCAGWIVPAVPRCHGRRSGTGVRALAGAGNRAAGGRSATMTVFTLANQLTLLRMLLIPLFVILVVYGYLGWALIVFAIAGLTDALDGLIARMAGQKSTLGAWLDPMADKLLALSTFVVLTIPGLGLENRLPVWLTVIIISRDVVIVLTVAIVNLAVGPRTFRPSVYGKLATATYMVTAVVTMFFNYLGFHSAVVDVFVYASLAVTLISSLHYIRHASRIIEQPA